MPRLGWSHVPDAASRFQPLEMILDSVGRQSDLAREGRASQPWVTEEKRNDSLSCSFLGSFLGRDPRFCYTEIL